MLPSRTGARKQQKSPGWRNRVDFRTWEVTRWCLGKMPEGRWELCVGRGLRALLPHLEVS